MRSSRLGQRSWIRMSAFGAAPLVVSLAGCAQASPSATTVVPLQPPALNQPSMTYDGDHTLLFGGLNRIEAPTRQTWEWGGSRWVLVSTGRKYGWKGTSGPNAGAFDANAGVTVSVAALSDTRAAWSTWIWSQNSWVASPSGSLSTASRRITEFSVEGVLYDPMVRSDILVSCGLGRSLDSTTVYSWSRAGWREISAAQPGPCSLYVGIAYDSANQRVMVYSSGGTWLWAGGTWSQAMSGPEPTGIDHVAMCGDPQSASIVLFGGSTKSGRGTSDTWIWNGQRWALQAKQKQPPPLRNASCSYDGLTKKVLLYGGSQGLGNPDANTWAWTGSEWVRQKIT